MHIQILYFAVFRDRIGRDDQILELADGARVRDAIEALSALHAPIASLRGKFRVAINQEFADEDRVLCEADELALIPPVAGGSDRHAELRPDALSLDRCIAAVRDTGMGGIVTFTGMVRRHSRGVIIERLEYEAYAAMAVREMSRLCDEIEAEVTGARIAVEHRIGTLQIGDLAVVIAAAAPHRAEAFAACRAMIDRLKDRVPIWKREIGEHGAVWVGLGP